MRIGITRYVNGLQEEPLRPCAFREKNKFQQQAATSPGYRRRRALAFAGYDEEQWNTSR